MATNDGDLLMYVVASGGNPIAAESAASLDAGDKLVNDFRPGGYFDVETFAFGLQLHDNEGATRGAQGDTRRFVRWRALRQENAKPNPPYQADAEDFVFTRRLDSASPILMQQCLDSKRLDKAVLVKRDRVGDSTHTSFLRLEFEKLWLKSVDWSDGDVVRESCRLQFTSVKVTYVKRQSAGKMASQWPCQWNGLARV